MTKIYIYKCQAISYLFLIAGCGGGGGSESAAPPVVVSPGTPAPSPAPSPSPVPEIKTIDFAKDFYLSSDLWLTEQNFIYTDEFNRFRNVPFSSEVITDGRTAALGYTASPEGVQAVFGGENWNFPSAPTGSTIPYRRYYRDDHSSVAVGWKARFQYVTAAFLSPPAEIRSINGLSGKLQTGYTGLFGFVSGMTTAPNSLSYRMIPIMSGSVEPEYAVWGDLRLDLARPTTRSDSVEGYFSVSGVTGQKASLTITGTFDAATNRFVGTMVDRNTGYSGTLKGALYGPSREELGVVFSFSRSVDGGLIYTGSALASKN